MFTAASYYRDSVVLKVNLATHTPHSRVRLISQNESNCKGDWLEVFRHVKFLLKKKDCNLPLDTDFLVQ
jgi:hypothetical protein